MTKKKHPFYCWMRILKATASASAVAQEPNPGGFEMLVGPRPPKRKSKDGGSTSLPQFAEAWYADIEYQGDPTSETVFDYGPAFVKRDNALTWLGTTEGSAWVADAVNYQLFCFELEE
jgi:hypothetical protein